MSASAGTRRDGWEAMIPTSIRGDPRLSAADHRIVETLAQHARNAPTCYPGNRRIAELARTSPSYTRARLARLESLGIIRRVFIPTRRHPNRRRRVFVLLWHPETAMNGDRLECTGSMPGRSDRAPSLPTSALPPSLPTFAPPLFDAHKSGQGITSLSLKGERELHVRSESDPPLTTTTGPPTTSARADAPRPQADGNGHAGPSGAPGRGSPEHRPGRRGAKGEPSSRPQAVPADPAAFDAFLAGLDPEDRAAWDRLPEAKRAQLAPILDDPIGRGEAIKAIRGQRRKDAAAPPPEATDLPELARALANCPDPTFPLRVCEALQREFDDRHSYRFYATLTDRIWRGRDPEAAAALAACIGKARNPACRKPAAVFVHELKAAGLIERRGRA